MSTRLSLGRIYDLLEHTLPILFVEEVETPGANKTIGNVESLANVLLALSAVPTYGATAGGIRRSLLEFQRTEKGAITGEKAFDRLRKRVIALRRELDVLESFLEMTVVDIQKKRSHGFRLPTNKGLRTTTKLMETVTKGLEGIRAETLLEDERVAIASVESGSLIVWLTLAAAGVKIFDSVVKIVYRMRHEELMLERTKLENEHLKIDKETAQLLLDAKKEHQKHLLEALVSKELATEHLESKSEQDQRESRGKLVEYVVWLKTAVGDGVELLSLPEPDDEDATRKEIMDLKEKVLRLETAERRLLPARTQSQDEEE